MKASSTKPGYLSKREEKLRKKKITTRNSKRLSYKK
jgi:hypothetical protein